MPWATGGSHRCECVIIGDFYVNLEKDSDRAGSLVDWADSGELTLELAHLKIIQFYINSSKQLKMLVIKRKRLIVS